MSEKDERITYLTLSLPLPKDHWLYKPMSVEWDVIRDDVKECPHPIIDISLKQKVIDAVRFAYRRATMCGTTNDVDPDALVQNVVYALCGPSKCMRSDANPNSTTPDI